MTEYTGTFAEPSQACEACTQWLHPNKCKHCGRKIFWYFGSWAHDDTDEQACDDAAFHEVVHKAFE